MRTPNRPGKRGRPGATIAAGIGRSRDESEEVKALTHAIRSVIKDHSVKGEKRNENQPRSSTDTPFC